MSDEGSTEATHAERLSALEAGLADVRRELAELRQLASQPRASSGTGQPQPSSSPPTLPQLPGLSSSAWGDARARDGRQAAGRSTARAFTSRADLESVVGRYGTLAAGALVLLIGIGTLVVWAVQRGLLTPEVRVALGALATLCVASAGLLFRRRGDVRYGNALLALSLAMTDVVAWGAGPRLHLVPNGVALVVVDLVSFGVAALAVLDQSELLLSVAAAGALAAPFVTSDRPGRAALLLSYGVVVQLGAMRAGRGRFWHLLPLVLGAVLYVFAAGALPIGSEWYDAYLVPLFGGTLALGALTLPSEDVRGALSRGYLGIALLGVELGWDAVGSRPLGVTVGVAAAVAAVTYAALWVSEPKQYLWRVSALLLPLLSLGVAIPGVSRGVDSTLVLLAWAALAGGAWRAELARGTASRGGAHLALAVALVGTAIANQLRAESTSVSAGLACWAAASAAVVRRERSQLPLGAVGCTLLAAATVALLELTARVPYAYAPFATRASAAALAVEVALVVSAVLLRRADRVTPEIAALVPGGFALWWGRSELVDAYSADAATFLLTFYYAAVGVGAVVAGRRWRLPALRIGGLAVALYAAAKAMLQATGIDTIGLRVGCYVLVGVFLLGAGWVYREAGVGPASTTPQTGR